MTKKDRTELNNIYSTLEGLKSRVEEIGNAEREKYDNLSQGLQQAERGEQMDAAASALEQAVSSLEDALSNIEEAQS